MELIIDGRGSGKTTKLIVVSSMLKIPIVTNTLAGVDCITDIARKRNLQIPEPVTVEQMSIGYCMGWRGYENVLVDDAYTSGLLEDALNQYLHANVKACVIDKSSR